MTQPGALNALDSTALHQSVPAPPLPLLPIELYTYIIQLALPPPAYHSIPQRNAVLRSWALVHSTWAACIRCELWRDLYLPNTSRGRDVHYWLINQAIDRDPACAAIVETLWVHFADPDPEGLQTTWELVQRFNNLKNVNARSQNWRSGFKWFELARTAPQLESLTMHGFRLPLGTSTPSVAPSFHHLRTLALTSPPFVDINDVLRLLHPDTIPNITKLALSSFDSAYFSSPSTDALPPMASAISLLAPQLTSFAFDSPLHLPDTNFLLPIWPLFTSLQHLALPHDRDHALMALSLLSPTIKLVTLRLRANLGYPPIRVTTSLAVINSSLPCLEKLRQFVFPPPMLFPLATQARKDELKTEKELLRVTCEEKGIECLESRLVGIESDEPQIWEEEESWVDW